MCVRSDCTVASHVGAKAVDAFTRDAEEFNEMIFIGVQSTDPPSQVHLKPAIPACFCPVESLSEMMVRTQTIDMWTVMFDALAATGPIEQESDGEKKALVVDKVLQHSDMSFAVTPSKRQRREDQDPSSPEEAYELLSHDIEGLEPSASDQEKMTQVVQSWQSLVDNVKMFSDIALNAKAGLEATDKEFEQGLGEMETKLAAIKSLVGNREDDLMGTSSLVESVVNLLAHVERLQTSTDQLTEWKRDFQASLSKTVADSVMASIRSTVFEGDVGENLIQPLARLLGLLSPSKDEPGKLLMDTLDKMEARIHGLESQGAHPGVASSASAARPQVHSNAPMMFPTFGSSTLSTGPTPSSSNVASSQNGPPTDQSDLRAEVASLKNDLALLQSQMGNHVVKIEGKTFRSIQDARAWLTRLNLNELIMRFVDPISMLSLSDNVVVDEAEATNKRARAQKLGDSPELTAYKASFNLIVPAILGKSADAKVLKESKVLPAVPTYRTWNTGRGCDGVKDILQELTNEGAKDMKTLIDEQLGGEAREIACELLRFSRLFWGMVSEWITDGYTELKTRSGGSDKECWGLMSHSVRAMLKLMRKGRSIGKSGHPEHMLWGTLQAYRIGKELLDLKFEGHPEISVILHQHLIDNAVPRSIFDALVAKVGAMEKSVTTAEATANKAFAKAEAALKKRS